MFSDYEKKIEKENISEDEFSFEEDSSVTLSCSDLEDDEKQKLNPTLNIIKLFFLIFSFLMIVGMAVHVARVLYPIIEKKIFIYTIVYQLQYSEKNN